MRKENEFGGMYYQMDFPRADLETILSALYSGGGVSINLDEMNIIDRIEKELGIE
jgi:hypothetical protein